MIQNGILNETLSGYFDHNAQCSQGYFLNMFFTLHQETH